MRPLPSSLLRASFIALIATVTPACAGDSTSPSAAAGSFGQTVAHYGDWNGALMDTIPDSAMALPQTVLTASNGDNWVCRNTQLDDKRNLDQLLTPGNTAGVLWPGALIQGQPLRSGTPAEIPLPRSPITISIDLAVDSAAIHVDNPTSASVQQAIAVLQREADSRLGPIDVVPARINFSETQVNQSSQANLDLGISLSAAGKVEGVNLSASIGFDLTTGKSYQAHTIAVTLIQPMYTITFADEEKPSPDDYLASTVTSAQVQDVMSRGLISGTNLPTYVKSVTYGRMLVFSMTNTTTATSQDLEIAVRASVSAFKLGGSTDDHLAVQDSTLLQNSQLVVQTFGGSQDSALAAIRTGNLGRFFSAVPATQAVPLSYRINYLKNGQVALLGAEVTDTASDCSNAKTQGQYWHIKLDSVSSNGGCDSAQYVQRAFVVTDSNFVNYPLLAVAGVPMKDTLVNREIVLQVLPGDSAFDVNHSFNVAAFFFRGTSDSTTWNCEGNFTDFSLCARRRSFQPGDQFAVNPYTFTQILTLPGPDAACTVTFTYRIFLEPVLSPPAPTSSGKTTIRSPRTS